MSVPHIFLNSNVIKIKKTIVSQHDAHIAKLY